MTRRPQWQALQQHAGQQGQRHLRELFAADPVRGERLHAEAAGLYLDYSKQRISDETLGLLLDLANACGLEERIAAMFRGEKINTTENRAVLHTALRAPAGAKIDVDGNNVVPDVHAVLERMAAFAGGSESSADFLRSPFGSTSGCVLPQLAPTENPRIRGWLRRWLTKHLAAAR